MKFSYSSILLIVLSLVLCGGFGVLAYFIFDNSLSLQTLQTKKINKTAIYDRSTIDRKLPVTIGPPGPQGPPGDPSSQELILEINNLYPFDHFGELPPETPIILKFTTDFKNPTFAGTTFSGWITKTVNLSQELLGQIYHEGEKKSLGSYKILTTRLDTLKFTNHIAWEFIKLAPKYLQDHYLSKKQLDQALANRADVANSYNKSQTASKLQDKADQALTPNKLEIDNRIKGIAPPVDAYNQAEINEKLAKKADKSDTYTKPEVDTKINQKIDRWDLYSRQQSDDAIAKKADKSYAYTKTEVDNKIKQGQTFNWTKFVRSGVSAGKTITKVYGNTKFSSGAFRNSALYLKMAPAFFKGDRLTIIGRIKSLHNGYQGLNIDLRNLADPTGLLNIYKINHWNRWHDGGTVKTKKLALTFNPLKDLGDYPLFAANKTFKNHLSFRMEIVFGTGDNIFVYTYAQTNRQTTLDEVQSVVVIKYPSNYNDAKGLGIVSVFSEAVVYATGEVDRSASADTMASGSELIFIRDIRNREFGPKTISTKTVESHFQ